MADADVDGLPELVLLPDGAAFGSYIIHECIGQGAMGNVYRAEHALLEKPVAVKVLDASLLSSSDARERFLREGQAAAAIKHPNVVDITDVGVFEGTPYLVMELLEGEDLQIYLQRKPQLSEREVASLLLPIAAALGAAHDRGVVHRDLKPSNIFLSRGPDGEIVPKILDFGISKIAHALASTDFQSTPFNQLMGSPRYLPPEAVRGSRDLTAKSDQYSFGVVLYECITGLPPFAGESLLAILNSIAAGEFAKPSGVRFDVSEVMERAILRSMNPDPSLRYDHVRDLGRELLEVAGARSKMLWGRSFGRIDLSEPALDVPSNRTHLALLPSTTEPARSSTRFSARRVWLGLGLAAIAIASFWGMRAPEPESEPIAKRVPETGEASLRPALDSVRAAAGPVLDVAPAANPPSETHAAPVAVPVASAAPAVQRPRVPRHPRAILVAESRATLVPDIRPRPVSSRQLSTEANVDDLGRMFPPLEASHSAASRAAPGPVLTGANEAPILD